MKTYICDISLNSSQKDNFFFSDKICRENQNIHFMFNNVFPPKIVPFIR